MSMKIAPRYANLAPAVTDLHRVRAELDRLYIDWATVGNPYGRPALLDQIARCANTVALCAKQIADDVREENQ